MVDYNPIYHKSRTVTCQRPGKVPRQSTHKILSNSYPEIKALIEELSAQNMEDLDILVTLNEKFPRDLVNSVLEDLRRKGEF